MNGRLFLTILLLSLTITVTAQRRQLQEARVILKGDKDYDKAEKLMTDLLKDSANLSNARIYDMWLQAVEKQYLQVNERMYKKEQVDTAGFFGLTRRMFDEMMQKPMMSNAINTDMVVSRTKLWRYLSKNMPIAGTLGMKKKCIR